MKLEKKTFTSTFKGFKDGTPLKALVHLFTFAVHVLGYIYIFLFFFSSLSCCYGLDMLLATRDALVINGRSQVFFTSSYQTSKTKGPTVIQWMMPFDGFYQVICSSNKVLASTIITM